MLGFELNRDHAGVWLQRASILMLVLVVIGMMSESLITTHRNSELLRENGRLDARITMLEDRLTDTVTLLCIANKRLVQADDLDPVDMLAFERACPLTEVDE